MQCRQVQDRLSAFIDGCLAPADLEEVEAHLAACEGCRAACEALQSLDASLAEAIRPERERAEALAERVLEQLADAPPDWVGGPVDGHRRALGRSAAPVPGSRRIYLQRTLTHLAAVAVGVLIAVAFLTHAPDNGPGVDREPMIGDTLPLQNDPFVQAAHVARIVHTTGPVSFRRPQTDDWQTVPPDDIPNFTCPTGAALKTEAGSLCELETTAGCRIRLNETTEIAFRSEENLELARGQLWCSAPDDATLRVVAQEPSGPASPPLWQFSCSDESQCIASALESGALQVVVAAGSIDLTIGDAHHDLTTGAYGALPGGELSVTESEEERLLAERWMQPLLTLAGHENPELVRRVDSLLAWIGRTKVSYLFEQDIRNLGEYGALPVLKFVQSDESRDEPQRRQAAMKILVDTAPVWTAPELIALLDDDDALVRSDAARTLTRLTGNSQGLAFDGPPPDEQAWAGACAGWKQWWADNQFSCPPSPAGVRTIAPERSHYSLPYGPAEEFLKARN